MPRPPCYRLHAGVVGKSAPAVRHGTAVAIKDGNFTCPIVRASSAVSPSRLDACVCASKQCAYWFYVHAARLTVSVGNFFNRASRSIIRGKSLRIASLPWHIWSAGNLVNVTWTNCKPAQFNHDCLKCILSIDTCNGICQIFSFHLCLTHRLYINHEPRV